MLDQQQYPLTDFSHVYYARWVIEELYKISKQLIDIEDFHGQTETTVQQEYYAHLFLINVARIFKSQAKNNLSLSTENFSRAEAENGY